MLLYRILRFGVISAFALILGGIQTATAQPGSANVLFADHPQPVRIGVEIGATYTNFMNGAPTFFPTRYPYSPSPDTIHMWFPSGESAGFGIHIGIAADISISDSWGLLAKLNYNSRHATWHAQSTTLADTINDSGPFPVPLTNDVSLTLRYLSAEIMARYSIKALNYFYLAGGFALSGMLSNNYTTTQELGGPPEISFVNFGTGNGTGVRKYTLTDSFHNTFNNMLAELKLLAGYPIRIGHRWTLNPEVTLAYPLTPLFNSDSRAAYQSEGIGKTPSPLTFTGILALRYEL